MKRYFLSEVRIEGFRGINNEGDPLVVKFDPKSVNSIFAQNGSGKSSIFEALQYAFSGTVSRLREMQASEQPDDYLPNLFHSTGRSIIDLKLTPDDGSPDVDIQVVREPTGKREVVSPSGHPNPSELLRSLNQDFTLLDYSKFSKFIEDTALSRGRSFSALLGLSDYADVRRALQTVAQTQAFRADFDLPALEERQRRQSVRLDNMLAEFSERYKDIVEKDFADISAIAKAGADIAQVLANFPLIEKHIKGHTLDEIDFKAVKSEVAAAEKGAERERLAILIQKRQKLTSNHDSPASVKENLVKLRAEIETYEAQVAEISNMTKHALLHAAEAFFEAETDWQERDCPLCGSALDASLKEHIRLELKAFETVDLARWSIQDLLSNGAFLRRLRFLEQLPEALEPDESEMAASLLDSSRSRSLKLEELDVAKLQMETLESRVATQLTQIKSEIGELQQRLSPSLVSLTTKIASAEAAFATLESIHTVRAEIRETTEQLNIFNRWKEFIDATYQTYGTAESSLSKTILSELRDEYQKLFKEIMGIDDVVPMLNREGQGEQLKVELEQFYGQQQVSARAVLSESYRNALAISVFLSAAVKYGKKPRFIVLDDITSSFDSGHQFHLMEQIRSRLQFPGNSDGMQFIVLSHDVTLEKYFDRLGDEPGWKHQKLQGWPPHTSISALGQDPNRLRAQAEKFLREGLVDQASGLIRQYLEFTLQQVIRKLKIPVPIDLAVSDHSKMVGTCIDAILTAVNLHDKAGSLCMEPQQVSDLKGRHAPAIVSNWINHYGTGGSAGFSPPSLQKVLSDIDSLRRCFQYDASNSGDWRFYRSLECRK